MTRPLPSTPRHLDSLVHQGAEGWLVISTPERRGEETHWRSWSYHHTDVDRAAERAAHIDAQGQNAYVRSTLLNRPLTRKTERGGDRDTGAVVSLVLDLDVEGPGHRNGQTKLPLPPDLATGMRALSQLPPPSLTIFTGGGNHLWWHLKHPLTGMAQDLIDVVSRWKVGIVELGARAGYHFDPPGVSRVLRVAGTRRIKPGVDHNLVQITDVTGWPDGTRPWCPGGLYDAEELIGLLPKPELKPKPKPQPRLQRTGIGPAEALERLSWGQILEPLGWTYVGPGRIDGTDVEHWLRPGDPTSEYSAKTTADVIIMHSSAAGFPEAGGKGYTKLQAVAHLCYGGDTSAVGRTIRERANARARNTA